jgi:hypothetical protein
MYKSTQEKIEGIKNVWMEVIPFLDELELREIRRNHYEYAETIGEVRERMFAVLNSEIEPYDWSTSVGEMPSVRPKI